MNSKHLNKSLLKAVKIVSFVLINSAIGLELWHLYASMTIKEIPRLLYVAMWIERSALLIHFIEGVLAAFYAPFKGKSSIKYGIYTFFTGTISLFELAQSSSRSRTPADL